MVKSRDLTAVDGTDYALDTTTVTVPGGMMAPVTISGRVDDADEESEVFEISILSNAEYIVGSRSKATIYVKDVVMTTDEAGATGTADVRKYQTRIKV